MEGKIISVLFSGLFDLACSSTVIDSVNEDELLSFFSFSPISNQLKRVIVFLEI